MASITEDAEIAVRIDMCLLVTQADTPILNSELELVAMIICGKVGSDIDDEPSRILEHALNERQAFRGACPTSLVSV